MNKEQYYGLALRILSNYLLPTHAIYIHTGYTVEGARQLAVDLMTAHNVQIRIGNNNGILSIGIGLNY